MTDVRQETSVRVSRRFAAPREQVYDAWTSEDVLRRWWAGGPGREIPLAETDARPGGSYRLKEGTGEVSQVVVDFVEDGDGTEVVVVHTGIAEAGSREQHEQGWNAVLGTLERNVFPA